MADRLAFEHRVADGLDRIAGPHRPVDALKIARMAIATAPPQGRAPTRIGAAGLLAAASVLAVLGGLVYLRTQPTPPDDPPSRSVGQVAGRTDTPTAIEATVPASSSADGDAAPKTIAWESGGVRFEADRVRIHVDGREFEPSAPLLRLYGSIGDRGDGSLDGMIEGRWLEGERVKSLRIDLQADDTHWWISELSTGDGRRRSDDGDWLGVGSLHYSIAREVTRTPIGRPIVGDLTLEATSGWRGLKRFVEGARISIEGARLMAFAPGTIPTPPPLPWDDFPELQLTIPNIFLLPGQAQSLTAEACYQGDCRPMENARWRIRHPGRDRTVVREGSSIVLEAGQRVGDIDVNVLGLVSHPDSDRSSDTGVAANVHVVPRPAEARRSFRQPAKGEMSVHPDAAVLRVGDYLVITGWRCPLPYGQRFGPDREPGTADDDCAPSDMEKALTYAPGIAVIGLIGSSGVDGTGSSLLIHVDAFGMDPDDDLSFAGIGVTLESGRDGDHLQTPNIYVENQATTAPILGDVDADGDVDQGDVSAIPVSASSGEAGLVLDASTARFDLNDDKVVDVIDRRIAEAIASEERGPRCRRTATWKDCVTDQPIETRRPEVDRRVHDRR